MNIYKSTKGFLKFTGFLAVLGLAAGCAGILTNPNAAIAGTHTYFCEDGERIVVTYLNSPTGNTASLYFNGQHYVLPQAGLGGGTKFTGRNLSWWANGDRAVLEHDKQIRLSACKQNNFASEALAGN